MTRLVIVALLGLLMLATRVQAQSADDLIRFAAAKLQSRDLSAFADSARSWLESEEGRTQVGKLFGIGGITGIEDASDEVAASVWLAAGRAKHEKGNSAWQIVFAAQQMKITRIRLVVNSLGEPPPAIPTIAFRGTDAVPFQSPSALGTCSTLPSLCVTSNETGDPRTVEFLFATTRQQSAVTTRVSFTGERTPGLSFGAVRVRIPNDHKIGSIELPRKYSVFGISLYEQKPDPEKHFVIKSVTSLTQAEWTKIINAKHSKHAIVFVHGFNNSFDEASYRMGQIIWDLQYGGLGVLFTWASRSGVTNYLYDKDSALQARERFLQVLDILKQQGVERINIIAHSMGNFLVMEALQSQAQRSDPIAISELILAAPDVDRDQFILSGPTVRKAVGGMTLYASSADQALVASRTLARNPRAGDVTKGEPVTVPGIETIDVSAVGDDVLGLNHDTFAKSRAVIDDIGLLLSLDPRRLPHQRLREIRRVPELADQPRFWRYVK
jgi:esterase/lipase superfamily enzyme